MTFNLLSDVEWNFVDSDISANDKMRLMLDTILLNFDTAFPVKTSQLKNCNSHKIVWMTPSLKSMRETLGLITDAHNLLKTTDLRLLKNTFKRKYNSAIKKAKVSACDRYILNNSNNSKAMWNLINKMKPSPKEKENVLNVSPNKLNNFFTKVAEDIISSLPTSNINPITIMSSVEVKTPQFVFSEISQIIVRDALTSLKNSYSKDVYGLTTSVIKSVQNIIIPPLTKIFNNCIKECLFPDCLKLATIVPIYKKRDVNDLNNYRPISLLPIISKILEKILMIQITEYFCQNNLFDNNQFGFRKGLTTEKAILALLNYINNSFIKKENYAASFLDLKKAFDCVSHEILISKLYFYNFSPASCKLITSYLTNRTQRVSVNGQISSDLTLKHGVPQGSILGPILFLIYVNDLPYHLSKADVILYADDTTIGVPFTSQKNQLSFTDQAQDWFLANKLSLNKDKTIKLTFTLNHIASENDVNSTKFLGLSIDSKLLWNEHGVISSKKISKNVYLLRMLSNTLSENVLKVAYFGLIHSILVYGLLAWGHSSSLQDLLSCNEKLFVL